MSILDLPPHEVGRDLDGGADEEPQVRADPQVGRIEREPVVHQGVGQPVKGNEKKVAARDRVIP